MLSVPANTTLLLQLAIDSNYSHNVRRLKSSFFTRQVISWSGAAIGGHLCLRTENPRLGFRSVARFNKPALYLMTV